MFDSEIQNPSSIFFRTIPALARPGLWKKLPLERLQGRYASKEETTTGEIARKIRQ
jgi:hypothetical protein